MCRLASARLPLALAPLLLLLACSAARPAPEDPTEPPTPDRTDPSLWPDQIGDERIARIKWPANYAGGTLPVVLQLHGYTGNGAWEWQWPDLAAHIDDVGILLVTGEGTVDSDGDRFWNATDACCDLFDSGVDDVAWLTSVLDTLIATFPVDTDRIYVTGLSNGGFMSYRMACAVSDRVAAIASVAGMDYADATACVPAAPVSVLHIHGTADDTVPYDGWTEEPFVIPSARASVQRWAERAGCDATPSPTGTADYVDTLAGTETTREEWATGCAPGHSAALWTMSGAEHVPSFTPALGRDLLDWLLAHDLTGAAAR